MIDFSLPVSFSRCWEEVNDRGARLALCERGRRRVVSPHGVGAVLG